MMAVGSPSSSCNGASLFEDSSIGSLDSSDGGRMQSPVSFLRDPVLPSFDQSSMMHPCKGLTTSVFELARGPLPSLLLPKTPQSILATFIVL
jgi:hypothetical protein